MVVKNSYWLILIKSHMKSLVDWCGRLGDTNIVSNQKCHYTTVNNQFMLFFCGKNNNSEKW